MRRRRLLGAIAAVAGAILAGDVAVLAGRRGSGQPPSAAPTSPRAASTRTEPEPEPTTRTTTPAERSEPPTVSPATEAATETSPPTTPAPAARVVEVIPRAAWGAAAPVRAMPTHAIAMITVHHTAVIMTDAREGPARMRAHQRHHLDGGFADLAYHFIIDVAGNVYEGRPVSAPGETFTEYDPAGHFLATAEGNFDEQVPPAEQLGAMADLLAWASARFGVAPAQIAGHDDFAATSCPGASLRTLVDDGGLATEVQARLDRGGVELRLLTDEQGRARVAAIESGA